MTACIGALTVIGPSIVLAADTRVTHGSSPVEPNDQVGKQYPLPPYNFATAIAGSITECHEFVGRLVQRLELLSKGDRDPNREEVMDAVNDARFQVFKPKIDQALRASLGSLSRNGMIGSRLLLRSILRPKNLVCKRFAPRR